MQDFVTLAEALPAPSARARVLSRYGLLAGGGTVTCMAKALDPGTMHRAATLVGMGLTQKEAAGALGIHTTTVERVLQKPEYRKVCDDVRASRTSLASQVARVVQDMLAAVDHEGNPNLSVRQKGAELWQRNPELIDAVLEDTDDGLLPGVVLRFPYTVEPDDALADALAHAEPMFSEADLAHAEG